MTKRPNSANGENGSLEELQEKEHRQRQAGHLDISFKKYKNKRMKPRTWLRLPFEYKQGLVPSKCVPLPLNWIHAIPESLWWLPRVEKDGWILESLDYPHVKRAMKYDYTAHLYETILDYATGGNVKRHEGGNMVMVIEGLQRTGKSDLAKTIAKFWKIIQWDIRGRDMKQVPKIYIVLNRKELDKALVAMGKMDILIADELDKWTGLGSRNRAEGYANLVARIAKTGKSFIFVSPEVRIPTIKQLAYLVLTTYGICYAYEATRFIVSKKSRYTQQYKLLGLAAVQRNWRFHEFREYHEKKSQSIKESEKLLGLSTGFDREQVEQHRELIWRMVFNHIYSGDEDLFYHYSISMSDWRDYAGSFTDEDGVPLFDVEGLGGEYARYVCKGLASAHKIARLKYKLDKKKGKALGTYAQEIDVSAIPKSVQHVRVADGQVVDASALSVESNLQIDFRPIINLPLEHNYIEQMYQYRREAIHEKWGQDSVWGKKIEGTEMLQLVKDMEDMLLSWRLIAMGYSTRKAARELTAEGFKRSHVTANKHFGKVQETIAGIMDELAFAAVHPHLERIGGEAIKGQRDFVYKNKKGDIIATISKKERQDKHWRPTFDDLSEKEREDVLNNKPVFLVCTELETQRMQYWIVKAVNESTEKHLRTVDEWKVLAKEIFVDRAGLDITLEGEDEEGPPPEMYS